MTNIDNSAIIKETYDKLIIIKETYGYMDLGNSLYNLVLSEPEITFDLTGQFAGRAFGNRWLIKYNYPLISQHMNDLSTITAHEMAHLFEYKIFGKVGHKNNWKQIMQAFGISNPQRCHNFNIGPFIKPLDKD